MSEINDIEELPGGTFPINLKLIQNFHRLEPSIIDNQYSETNLIDKYTTGIYHKGFPGGSSNT